MAQNPAPSLLFVSEIKAGPGIKVSPAGTGIVTVSADDGGTGNFPVVTPITTVGAGTLTAAAIVGQQIARSGPTGAFTDTTDTAAAIVAAIPNAVATQSFYIQIANSTAFPETLANGSGVTLSGFPIIPANSTGLVLVTLTSLTAVAFDVVAIVPNVLPLPVANTNITTVGAGTLTAAAIAGGLITRSGSTAAFIDTSDTAANIVAAIPNAAAGMSFPLTIVNSTNYTETLAADGGATVTLAGFSVVPGNCTGRFVVTLTSLTAVTIRGVGISSNVPLPAAKFTTAALTAGAIPAASITGAAMCYWQNTGSTPGSQTFPTAATLFAAIPNAFAGMVTAFRVINTGAGTLTLTADGGATVTINGTAATITNTFRDYTLTFTSPTAATVQSVGSGVSP